MSQSGYAQAVNAAGGSAAALASLLGITAAAVSQWREIVPPRRAIQIEQKTNGRVTRYDIRPDHFGQPPKSRRAA